MLNISTMCSHDSSTPSFKISEAACFKNLFQLSHFSSVHMITIQPISCTNHIATLNMVIHSTVLVTQVFLIFYIGSLLILARAFNHPAVSLLGKFLIKAMVVAKAAVHLQH